MKINNNYYFLIIFIIYFFNVEVSYSQFLSIPYFANGGGWTLEEAQDIGRIQSTPWTFLNGVISPRSAKYWKGTAKQGDTIKLELWVPPDQDSQGFLPGLVLFGTNLTATNNYTLPSFVEMPLNKDYQIFIANWSQSEMRLYFLGPFAYYYLGTFEVTDVIAGDYYIAIFSIGGEGQFGARFGNSQKLNIFPEDLALWLLWPFAIFEGYHWTNQMWIVIGMPIITTLEAGLLAFIFLFVKRIIPFTAFAVVTYWAAIIAMSSGFLVLYQWANQFYLPGVANRITEICITIPFFIVPILIGTIQIMVTIRTQVKWYHRVLLIILAISGLASGSGYIIGPIIGVIGSLLPAKDCLNPEGYSRVDYGIVSS